MKSEGSEGYIQWMGGAGFMIEYQKTRIGLDLYISNACMNQKGEFKRLTLPPCAAEDIKMDYLISSHEHGDHLDMGSLEKWFEINENLKLIGPGPSLEAAKKIVPQNRMLALNRGGRVELAPEITAEGVVCDHGENTPGAIGVVLSFGRLRVYFMGDMQYHPDLLEITGVKDIDILLVPINPAFGNPGAEGAAKMTATIAPKLTVIPCHFWLFKEHGAGDPGSFEAECAKHAPKTRCTILAIGEKYAI